jgi:ATP-binding cassette subfamily F protein uup
MTLLTLKSIRKDFGIKEILRDASFSLEEGDKVGLIGTNGSGKSTLLKMIAGMEPIDGGEIWRNASAKVVYLPQQPEFEGEPHGFRAGLCRCWGANGADPRVRAGFSPNGAGGRGFGYPDDRLSRLTEQIDAAGAWDLGNQRQGGADQARD